MSVLLAVCAKVAVPLSASSSSDADTVTNSRRACSLAKADSVSAALFARSLRITNYSNRYDKGLKVSNPKRLGLRPRAGRVGIPDDAYPSVADVDCSEYFNGLGKGAQTSCCTFCHSWHIGNRVFARDLAWVLHGGIDRHAIPTRRRDGDGLALRDAPRLPHESRWLEG